MISPEQAKALGLIGNRNDYDISQLSGFNSVDALA
jgi:hypothetical protein